MAYYPFLAPVTWGRVELIAPLKAKSAIIIASGPSVREVTQQHIIDAQAAGAYVIVVNDAGRLFDMADAWFTLDAHSLRGRLCPNRGNKWYAAIPEDFGTDTTPWILHRGDPPTAVTYLHRLVGNGPLASKYGLSEDPSAIYTGNSGSGAVGLAYLMGFKRIALLGVDGTSGYFYDRDGRNGDLSHLPKLFDSMLPQLDAKGVQVFNGSPNSIVSCFPRMPPIDAINHVT